MLRRPTTEKFDVVLIALALLACLAVCIAGCMEQTIAPVVKPPVAVGLAADIRKINLTRSTDIVALSVQCLAQADQEAAKKMWNDQYHLIVSNAVSSLTTKIKAASDAATTPETRTAFWLELQKGFAP